MARTVFMPMTTLPKMVCLPSSQGVALNVRKNWLPSVPGPAFAMLSRPPPVCRTFGANSPAYWYPGPPVPVPSGHPPCAMNPGMIRWKINPS